MANNPTLELMTEFYRYKTIAQCYGNEAPEAIGCIISIGAGIVPITKIALRQSKIGNIIKSLTRYGEYVKNMVTILIKQLTSSDGSLVDTSRAWCHSLNVPFYRFSPPLKKAVDLVETRDDLLMDMLWDTEYYMVTKCSEEVEDLVSFIRKIYNFSHEQEAFTPENYSDRATDVDEENTQPTDMASNNPSSDINNN